MNCDGPGYELMDELTTEQGIVSLLHNEEEGKEEDHLESNLCFLYTLKALRSRIDDLLTVSSRCNSFSIFMTCPGA